MLQQEQQAVEAFAEKAMTEYRQELQEIDAMPKTTCGRATPEFLRVTAMQKLMDATGGALMTTGELSSANCFYLNQCRIRNRQLIDFLVNRESFLYGDVTGRYSYFRQTRRSFRHTTVGLRRRVSLT